MPLFFTLEIMLSSIAREDYFLKFYFWLDAMATVSLISDIGWIWDKIVGNQDFSASNAQQASQLARAGRGARVGTRAGRIIRIIRLIRLIRVVKLYKHAHIALAENNEEGLVEKGSHHENEGTINRSERSFSEARSHQQKSEKVDVIEKMPQPEIKDDLKIPEESKVGKKLSDLTTKRVIILVLAMMFSVPIFSMTTYREENNSFVFGLELIDLFSDNPQGDKFQTAFNTYLAEHKDIRTPLISLYVEIGTFTQTWDSDSVSADKLRFSEAEVATIKGGDYVAIFDLRKNIQLTSGLSIGRTFFVCFVLAAGALFFSKDANDLVITPIEQMIHKVNRISQNPLDAVEQEENEALALEQAQEDEEKTKKKKKKKKEGPYETVILEQTIVKIGALLALGFGEAGSKIIADNMAHTGDVDPMIPGRKILGIFGF